MSWRDGLIADAWGDESQVAYVNRDTCWEDMIDLPGWDDEDNTLVGWSYLDPGGYRYYLPASLIRSLDTSDVMGWDYRLTLPAPGRDFYDLTLSRWTLLTGEQCVCVARYLQLMAAAYRSWGNEEWVTEDLGKALASHWHKFVDHEPNPYSEDPN